MLVVVVTYLGLFTKAVKSTKGKSPPSRIFGDIIEDVGEDLK